MATSTVIGQVKPFQLGTDDWEQYIKGLKQLFLVNGIVTTMERSCLFDGSGRIDLCLAE